MAVAAPRRVGKEPSSPAKFAWSLIFVAAGFAILIIPAQQGGQVSPMWLTMTYLLHTIGELLLSPVGLSAMTKLAPARIAGLVMGIWFLATSVGNYIGGRVSGLYESFALPTLFGAVAAFGLRRRPRHVRAHARDQEDDGPGELMLNVDC